MRRRLLLTAVAAAIVLSGCMDGDAGNHESLIGEMTPQAVQPGPRSTLVAPIDPAEGDPIGFDEIASRVANPLHPLQPPEVADELLVLASEFLMADVTGVGRDRWPELWDPEAPSRPCCSALEVTAGGATVFREEIRHFGPSYRMGDGTPVPPTRIPIYDTAWMLPVLGTVDEASDYFAGLATRGFTGAWISVAHNWESIGGRNANGDRVTTGGWNEQITFTDQHLAHVRRMLDAAWKNGRSVGVVMMWARTFTNDGSLNAGNAYGVGYQLGTELGGHRAVAHWVAGGDNYLSFEDEQIWVQMVAGLRDAGAYQPVTYHTPPGDYSRFADSSWVDFLAPETGHCQAAATTGSDLAELIASTTKPVFAGEMRYEAINPDWCTPPGGAPVPASEVIADVDAAIAAGVSGIVYGHNTRWQWGHGLLGGPSGGGSAALASLDAPGGLGVVARVSDEELPPLRPVGTFAPRVVEVTLLWSAERVNGDTPVLDEVSRVFLADLDGEWTPVWEWQIPSLSLGPGGEIWTGPREVTPPADAIRLEVGTDIQQTANNYPDGTAFLLASGVHRLQSVRPRPYQEFYGEPGAVLSGARVLEGWTRDGSAWYVTGQTQQGRTHGRCDPGYERCVHPEDLFVDSVPLRHVSSKSEVGPGSWFFDYGSDRIYVGENPSGRLVETSVVSAAVYGDVKGVTVAGLVVEKYANNAQHGAIDSRDSNSQGRGDDRGADWTVIGNEVRLNHGVGVYVTGASRVIGNVIHTNGQLGVAASGTGAVIEANEIASNNWARFEYGWEGGGAKFAWSTNLTVRDNVVHDNYGPGLWTDIDNIGTLYEGNTVIGNAHAGIFHEISYQAVIRNNHVEGNGFDHDAWLWGAGILIAASPNVEVYANTVVDNADGISAIQQDRSDAPAGYGEVVISNLSVHDNLITLNAGAQSGFVEDRGDNSVFTSRNNRFFDNTYDVDSSARVFGWDGRWLTFSEWLGYGLG